MKMKAPLSTFSGAAAFHNSVSFKMTAVYEFLQLVSLWAL